MLSRELFYRFLLSPRAGSLVRTISRISIVGIWIGVTALLLIMSIMNGFNRSIQDRLVNIEPHLVVTFPHKMDFPEIQKTDVFTELSERSDMQVDVFSTQDVILRTVEGKVQGAVARGVTLQSLKQLMGYVETKAGRSPEEIHKELDKLEPGEVVMGLMLAETAGLFEGNSVTIIPPENLIMAPGDVPVISQATVKGFVMASHETTDRHTLFYIQGESLPRLQYTAGIQRGLEIRLQDHSQVDYWKERIEAKGATVRSWKDRNASLFFALKVEKIVIAVLVGLSTLIAALSIISVMVLLLIQKQKDIGNFLAMGMTRKKTQSLFIQIGVLLSLIGVVVGVATGTVLSLVVDRFSQDLLPHFYQETNIPAELQIWQILAILLVAPTFAYVTLSWTMRRLSKMLIADTMKG